MVLKQERRVNAALMDWRFATDAAFTRLSCLSTMLYLCEAPDNIRSVHLFCREVFSTAPAVPTGSAGASESLIALCRCRRKNALCGIKWTDQSLFVAAPTPARPPLEVSARVIARRGFLELAACKALAKHQGKLCTVFKRVRAKHLHQ